ncbi:MAG: hypothetical protein MI923_09715 [Phycisphaerales bacterium]|nr:hypothetical protein [Phycisphaerales bacterium]
MGVEAAFAHLQRLGQVADGQPFQPFGRRQVGGDVEDLASGLLALGQFVDSG